METSDILNHLGEERESYFDAVTPPLMQSSNFHFPTIQAMREALKDEFGVHFYTRGNNPTVEILRKKVAALEGAEDALIFGSGSAAIAAAVMNSVNNGDHVVCVKKPYSWTDKLLNKLLVNYGIETTMIDGNEIENFERALKANTKLIIIESPNSVTFELQDIKAVADLAKSKGIATMIDNSYCTPLYQKPIEMGIDIVVHSASKFINGHSDVVAGVLCSGAKRIENIFHNEFMTLGGIISPNDAWLMIRGLRTLPIRLDRSTDSTEKVVAYLENHPKVIHINYPFSKKYNPQYNLAQKQMKRGGAMFSFKLDIENLEQADTFCNSLNCFLMACSWGGYESLIFPTSALYSSQNYGNTTQPFNLVRMYIGLEDPELLIKDLEQALEKI